MALPWFSFNIKKFLAETQRLNTEARGAYLSIKLNYYEQGAPPDDDEVLATITGLALDAWKRHRKVIAPLFQIKGGLWHNADIDVDMLDASSKHEKAVAKARTAAAAKYGKTASGMPQGEPQARPKRGRSTKSASSSAPSKPGAPDQASLENPHLHKQLTTTVVVVNGEGQHDDDAKVQAGLAGKEARKPGSQIDLEEVIAAKLNEPIPLNPLGTTLAETWVPDEQDQQCARGYGMGDSDIQSEVLMFHALNAQHGTFSKNWKATWQIFCSRWADRQTKAKNAVKPRVEVDNTPYKPTVRDWELALGMWQKDQSKWPFKVLGAEPGQGSCRAPVDLMRKYGIDPATGIYRAPAMVRGVS